MPVPFAIDVIIDLSSSNVLSGILNVETANSFTLRPIQPPIFNRDAALPRKMVTFNLAYTAPVNPAGATPALTLPQIWAGLERKVRKAQEFVPIIEECTVLSEETSQEAGNFTIVREVRFKAGFEPGSGGVLVKETCVHYPPCRVDFKQPDGSSVSNVVSAGPDGELLMTYVFEWRYPGVKEGSEEAKALEEKSWKTAKMAVHGSIDTIRRLVKDSEIQ
ncbi:hypothetical protein F5Y04DRAFT_293445 [Hypomontagnella monticulosa]|nr:hypothetical protein F5Y04DRAFT_293445 [Hypomontagnella monticulosa]